MRVVITGGAGFIGSHLCDRFLSDQHEVVCLDNFSTGSRRNVAHLADERRFRLIECDVSEGCPVEPPVDWVLHFASPASPASYLAAPIDTLRVGSAGTLEGLELARRCGAAFVMASTSEVYGDPLVHPQHESYWGHVNPVGPRSVYDEAKRFAESATMAYHRHHGVPTRIARIFNTYGPRMQVDDGRALPNFLVQAARGEPLTIYGDGRQTRSFCYVSDLVEGIVRLMRSECSEPINLGNPIEIAILELAEEIRSLVGSKSAIEHRPLPEDDPRQRRPDISRARELLGWEPKVDRREGLRKTLEYFRAALD